MIAGYLIFTVANLPAMLVAGPDDLDCDGCPENRAAGHHDPDLANLRSAFQTLCSPGCSPSCSSG